MVRVIALYEGMPDPERYERHVELCRNVPGSTFRHGPVVRTLFGDELKYYAEFEFPDMESFKAVAGSDEFRATGADAAEMGVPHTVHLVEVE
jgi:hypothetical protein